jgi:hypothetical protein
MMVIEMGYAKLSHFSRLVNESVYRLFIQGSLWFWMVSVVLVYWLRFYTPWYGWVYEQVIEAQKVLTSFFWAAYSP